MVCVGGDVGDEFLGGEREEALEGEWGGGGGEAGEEEVVRCYGVGDLLLVVRYLFAFPFIVRMVCVVLVGGGKAGMRGGEAYYRRIVIHF